MNRFRLSSLQNPLLKEYARLQRSRRFRKKSGKITLEGRNLVQGALNAGLVPDTLILSDEYLNAVGEQWVKQLPASTRVVVIAPALFKSLAAADSPQGVAAIIPYQEKMAWASDGDVHDLVLVLDRINDPGNLGTLIRTATAAGVGSIWYSRDCADPYSPKVLRATAGSIFFQNMECFTGASQVFDRARAGGYLVVGAVSGGGIAYWEPDYRGPVALIIGNESHGISPGLARLVSTVVTIPLSAPVESLNAAVAAGIILFEIKRRRLTASLA